MSPIDVPPKLADELERLRQRVNELERERMDPSSRAHFPIQVSADHYKLLYENTPSMSFALEPDGTILSVNHFGAEQLGYSPEALIGQSVLLVFASIDHHVVQNQLAVCSQNPYTIFQWEIQKVHQSGRRLWVRETARAVRNDEGQLIILVLCEDITTRKHAEQEAQSLTKILEALIRTSPLAIMALDNTGENVTIWNRAAEQMFGWSEQEVLGKPTPFLPMNCRDESDRLWQEVLDHGQLQAAEIRRVRKDGSPIDLSLWATVLRDQQGNVVGTFGLLADITDRKRMEATLRLNGQAIRELYELVSERNTNFGEQIHELLDLGRRRFQLPIAAFTTLRDEQLEITAVRTDGPSFKEGALVPLCNTFCSQTLKSELPLACEHIGATNWKDLPAYKLLGFEAYLGVRVTVQGKAVGTICFLSSEPALSGFSDSDRDFLSLMARWVSSALERLEAESRLRNSEERFRLMFENAPVGLCILNQDKTLRKINPAFQQLVGYSAEEILGHTYELYTHQDDLPGNQPLTDQLLRGSIPSYGLEKRYVRKDGRCIWVNVTASSLELPGEPDRLLLAVVEDITARKHAESALRFTQFAVDHAADLVFWIREDARIHYANDAAAQRLGYSREELGLMTVADIDPNYQANVWPKHWEELRLNKRLRFESCHRTKNGEIYPAEIVANYVTFEGNEYNFAFARDISERSAAEEALRASEERFSKAFRSSPYPIGITDFLTGACLDVNDAALTVFGYSREELVGQTTFTLGIWPRPEARQHFMDQIKSTGSVRNIEVAVNSKQGEPRRFLASSELIVLDGKECLVTIGNDITEQRRAEEALRRSELEVRHAFEERERLSQDLHDNLLQSLYAVGMGLELTKERIKRTSKTDAKRLEDSVAQMNAVIREVRGFIPRMQTPIRLDENVVVALRNLVDSFMGIGAGQIELVIDPESAGKVLQEQTAHILAIAREALSNSLRHSNATVRSVTLAPHRDRIRLEISDGGKGFDLRKSERRGMGITNMRARAARLNARFAIRTTKGKGTRITLDLPPSVS